MGIKGLEGPKVVEQTQQFRNNHVSSHLAVLFVFSFCVLEEMLVSGKTQRLRREQKSDQCRDEPVGHRSYIDRAPQTRWLPVREADEQKGRDSAVDQQIDADVPERCQIRHSLSPSCACLPAFFE